MTPELAGYERQKQFDDDLVKLGLFDFSEYGPSADVFESSLGRARYSKEISLSSISSNPYL
jgi:hypothetical protein